MIAGVVALMRMEVDIFLTSTLRRVVVRQKRRGSRRRKWKKVVTYPVETAVNGSTGVRRVRSASNTGFSAVWVEFDWGTDIYTARQIVAERLDAAAENLPENVSSPSWDLSRRYWEKCDYRSHCRLYVDA